MLRPHGPHLQARRRLDLVNKCISFFIKVKPSLPVPGNRLRNFLCIGEKWIAKPQDIGLVQKFLKKIPDNGRIIGLTIMCQKKYRYISNVHTKKIILWKWLKGWTKTKLTRVLVIIHISIYLDIWFEYYESSLETVEEMTVFFLKLKMCCCCSFIQNQFPRSDRKIRVLALKLFSLSLWRFDNHIADFNIMSCNYQLFPIETYVLITYLCAGVISIYQIINNGMRKELTCDIHQSRSNRIYYNQQHPIN